MPRPLSFDLVVATVDRTEPLRALLDSLAGQTHTAFRVLLVDQNDDDRLAPLAERRAPFEIVHLRSPRRGLSHGRNLALPELDGDVVAFPDDDCAYSPELLARVAALLESPALDGVAGRTADPHGRPGGRRFATDPCLLDRTTLWTRGNSASLFLRRPVVAAVGQFDERLGAGGEGVCARGEDVDYVIRAVDRGARILYEPNLVVWHDEPPEDAVERRVAAAASGRAVGWLLARHRFATPVLARMAVRPLGSAAASLARLDVDTARVRLATLTGRATGYLDGRSART